MPWGKNTNVVSFLARLRLTTNVTRILLLDVIMTSNYWNNWLITIIWINYSSINDHGQNNHNFLCLHHKTLSRYSLWHIEYVFQVHSLSCYLLKVSLYFMSEIWSNLNIVRRKQPSSVYVLSKGLSVTSESQMTSLSTFALSLWNELRPFLAKDGCIDALINEAINWQFSRNRFLIIWLISFLSVFTDLFPI